MRFMNRKSDAKNGLCYMHRLYPIDKVKTPTLSKTKHKLMFSRNDTYENCASVCGECCETAILSNLALSTK